MNASGWKRSDCGEAVAVIAPEPVVIVEPSGTIAAPLAGEAVTVCRLPDGMIGGLMLIVIAPAVSLTVCVTTNCCKDPVLASFCGLTATTPAIVTISPAFKVVAPEAHAWVRSEFPVWLAPCTVGVAVVKLPVV